MNKMKKLIIVTEILALILIPFMLRITGCHKDTENPPTTNDVWDIDKDGIPKFVSTNYIEPDKIYRISKYRSSIGHDYSDAYEHCRSMKHYFEPKSTMDWTTVKIYSPVNGKITRLEQEWAGTKIEIASDDYPAFRFSVFHINMTQQRNLNDQVTAGELLGTHVGSQTMSDISVIVNDPSHQGRMVSFFDVITDAVFNEYRNHGINSREDLIIPKTVRDANPLTCSGDTFVSSDTLENWVILN
jgi:hypothetical protein